MQFPLVLLQSKKHRVQEIVVPALRGQPGNTNFEAMSTKTFLHTVKTDSQIQMLRVCD
jgi:hypothetical protein